MIIFLCATTESDAWEADTAGKFSLSGKYMCPKLTARSNGCNFVLPQRDADAHRLETAVSGWKPTRSQVTQWPASPVIDADSVAVAINRVGVAVAELESLCRRNNIKLPNAQADAEWMRQYGRYIGNTVGGGCYEGLSTHCIGQSNRNFGARCEDSKAFSI